MITESTNYQSISTCVCIGENLAVSLPAIDGVVRMPLLSSAERILHVGRGADWDQRRAFDLGLLRGVAMRTHDEHMADQCTAGIAQLKARSTGATGATGAIEE